MAIKKSSASVSQASLVRASLLRKLNARKNARSFSGNKSSKKPVR